jgi:hypothetical protein
MEKSSYTRLPNSSSLSVSPSLANTSSVSSYNEISIIPFDRVVSALSSVDSYVTGALALSPVSSST